MFRKIEYIGLKPEWQEDVPVAIWYRLQDWGYFPDTSDLNMVIYGGKQILALISSNDEYYQDILEVNPAIIDEIKSQVTAFLAMYSRYVEKELG